MTSVPGPARPREADHSFVGRGFGWPLGVDQTGAIRLADGPGAIDRAISLVLMTAPGERVMRPEFGCRIWELLFEPVTGNLLGLIAQYVREALARWEPRVEVDAVVPTADPATQSLVRVEITYRVRATNDHRNLVYPFYVIPHDAE